MRHQYFRYAYSKKDVANVLGVPENNLEIRFFSNKYGHGLTNDKGEKLKFIKAMYLREDEDKETNRGQLVYVEFEDKDELTCSYVKDNYHNVSEQIKLDGFSNIDYNMTSNSQFLSSASSLETANQSSTVNYAEITTKSVVHTAPQKSTINIQYFANKPTEHKTVTTNANTQQVDSKIQFIENETIEVKTTLPRVSMLQRNEVAIQSFVRKKIKENINMNNLTKLDLVSLEKFKTELEDFIEGVKRYCRKMQSGIDYCRHEMKDEQSKTILEKSRMIVEHILMCVDPSILVLEKLKTLIDDIKTTTVSL